MKKEVSEKVASAQRYAEALEQQDLEIIRELLSLAPAVAASSNSQPAFGELHRLAASLPAT